MAPRPGKKISTVMSIHHLDHDAWETVCYHYTITGMDRGNCQVLTYKCIVLRHIPPRLVNNALLSGSSSLELLSPNSVQGNVVIVSGKFR